MAGISFDRQQRAELESQLRSWFADNSEHTLGSFEAGFLLDFISQQLGPHFYNRGVQDAQTLLATRVDELHESLSLLEQAPPRAGR